MIETFTCATFYLISELKLGRSIELFSVAPRKETRVHCRRSEGRNPGNREEWGDDAIVVDEW
jgi:hypothetical protein